MKLARTIWSRYREAFSDRDFLLSLGVAVVFLAAAFAVNSLGSMYAMESASNSVTDIVLSNIRVFDVDNLFVFGPIVFWVIVSFFLLAHPKRLPFALKTIALFVVVRTMFISLTHIGPFPTEAPIEGNLALALTHFFSSGSDLFFSGHTGGPYLMALVLWRYRWMRWFCLASSVFFGIVVLLGHYHYTIDVVAAFFITYSIYKISEKLFKTDLSRLTSLFSTVLTKDPVL